jgi:hypothetical protein
MCNFLIPSFLSFSYYISMHFFQKNKNDNISKKLYFFKYKCLLIYKSIILPHFDFCASVLYLMDKTKIGVLQKLQNRGMRIILKCCSRSKCHYSFWPG